MWKRWLLLVSFISVTAIISVRAGHTGTEVRVWLTTADRSNLLALQEPLSFEKDHSEDLPTVDVNPDIHYQTMDGFGAAITGSSAYLINHKMTTERREELLKELFTDKGINLSFVRHTIGASDYSVDAEGQPDSYTYDDVESGTDYDLKHFSIAKDKDVVGLLKNILGKNSGVKVMGTPWTAPPWMKYGSPVYNGWYLNYADSRIYEAYAEYFVRYIEAYQEEGIPIYAFTVQNEPEFTSPSYPSMSMGAAEQAMFIRDYLGPAIARNNLVSKIIGFDHNWDIALSYIETLLEDRSTKGYTEGIGFHCYAGSPETMSEVHHRYPDKSIYLTECSGGAWNNNFGENLSWEMSNLMIGGPRNWAQAVLLWNMALDPDGGPVNGGCSNCRGVITIDPESGSVERNAEYYALAHSSKFVQPGAVRIESNSFGGKVENVAYRNKDGSIVVVAANVSDQSQVFKVRFKGESFIYRLPPGGAVTFEWMD
jgi:glucosylceramidase